MRKSVLVALFFVVSAIGCGGGGDATVGNSTPGNFGAVSTVGSPSGRSTFTPCEVISASPDGDATFACRTISTSVHEQEVLSISSRMSITYQYHTGYPQNGNYRTSLYSASNANVVIDNKARTITVNPTTVPLSTYSGASTPSPTIVINGTLRY